VLAIPGGGIVLTLLCAGPAFADSYTVSSGQTVPITTQIVDGTTANSVTLSGGGTLLLQNAANSYSGGTTVIGSSILGITADGDLGATSGAVNLGNASSMGTLLLQSSTALSASRNIVINGGGGLISATPGTSSTVAGVISGTGLVTIGGGSGVGAGTGGTVTFSGVNTYSGGTSINAGSTLQVSADSGLGSSGTSVALGDATTTGTLSWQNSAELSTTRSFVLGGTGTTSTGGGVIMTNSAGSVTISGVLSGPGSLTSAGNGNLILTSANSYTGGTVVTGGSMLSINSDAALGTQPTTTTVTAGPVTLNNGTLQFNAAFSSARYVTLGSGGGTFDTDGNSNTLTGLISGTGSLTKVGTGILVLTGQNTYTGGTTVSAGSLQIGNTTTTTASLVGPVTVLSGGTFGGNGTITGDIDANSNSGGGTIYSGVVNGSGGLKTTGNLNLSSTSTLTVQMQPSGASTLSVGGAANLAGTLSVAYSGGFYKPGTYTLLTASSLSGSFSTVSVGVPSVGISGQMVEEGNQIDLVLTQLATLPDHPTLFTAITSAAIDEGQRTMGALLGHMVDVRSAAAADNMTAAWSSSHRIVSDSPYGYWFQPTGNYGKVKDQGGVPGFSNSGYGFVTGLDSELARGISAGIGFGYSRANVDETGSAAKGTIDVPRLMGYATWWHGPVAVDAAVSYGYAIIDGTRPITSAAEVAKSSHHGNELSGSLQASVGYALAGWAISPAAGVKFLALDEGRFTEKSADIYNYTVLGQTTNSARTFVNASVAKRFQLDDHDAVIPQVKVGYETEMMGTARHDNVMTAGDSYVWRINGVQESRGAATLNGGVTWETSRSQGFYVLYDREQSSSTTAQSFTAGVRYRL